MALLLRVLCDGKVDGELREFPITRRRCGRALLDFIDSGAPTVRGHATINHDGMTLRCDRCGERYHWTTDVMAALVAQVDPDTPKQRIDASKVYE